MDATTSILFRHLSIEKFLWDGVAVQAGELLINRDGIATRLSELEGTGHAILWNTTSSAAANTGELNLFVGATYYQDPGDIKLLTLLDKLNTLLHSSASVIVYAYEDGLPTIKVNELVIMDPIHEWPIVTEPNGFRTKLLSVKLKFAQKRS